MDGNATVTSERRIASRLAPFAAVTLAGMLLAGPWSATAYERSAYAAAVVAMLAVVATTLVSNPSNRQWMRLAPALLYVVAIVLLREASGGSRGGVGILVMVPVVWTALYGALWMLRATIAAVALGWAFPLLAIGAPSYPAMGWRSGVLLVALAAIVGVTVQRLVSETREQAEQARRHARERDVLLSDVSRLALTDPLTGVANRRSWEHRLQLELRSAGESTRPVSLVMLDLDQFKALNDRSGHDAGDRCLKESAAAWSALLRPDDMLARIGGDEFAIVLPACPLEEALAVVDRIRAATVGTTCSTGVAQWDGHEGPGQLQRRADLELYAAKRRV
jgi:diguanylate cyclase (GGDEF)-like protein